MDKKVVEHKSVVLWRAKEAEVVSAFDQIRLEMFFGSMVFTPDRKERKPPGTDRVLNWAAYGLWEDQNKHLLSAAEVADKKKLDRHVSKKKYEASPKGKDTRTQYEASESRKQNKRRYNDCGAKKVREFLEESEKNKRPAVQKTNEPSCGVLGDLLGGS